MSRPFDSLQNLRDVVQAAPRTPPAKAARRDPETLAARRPLRHQASPKRLVDHVAECAPAPPRRSLQLRRHIVIQGERRSHILMIVLRHHDVKQGPGCAGGCGVPRVPWVLWRRGRGGPIGLHAPLRRIARRFDGSVRLAAPACARRPTTIIARTVSSQLLLGLGYPPPLEIAVTPHVDEPGVLLAGAPGVPLAFVDPAEEIEAARPGLHGGPALMA